jgi:hypothetical protein
MLVPQDVQNAVPFSTDVPQFVQNAIINSFLPFLFTLAKPLGKNQGLAGLHRCDAFFSPGGNEH